MESLREIVPFAKEMMRQKPSRGMVKVYVVGTVLAFFGAMIGLVETIYCSFSPREPIDEEELARLIAREHHLQEHKEFELTETTEAGAVSKQQVAAVQRNAANRLHASHAS